MQGRMEARKEGRRRRDAAYRVRQISVQRDAVAEGGKLEARRSDGV